MTGNKSRSTSEIVGTQVVLHDLTNNQTLSYPASSAGRSTSITEYCHDGWRKTIKNGGIVMGELDRTIWSRSVGFGSIHEQVPQFGINQKTSGDFAGLARNAFPQPSLEPDPSALSRVRGNALIDAMSKANGSESFGGETLAQLSQTVSMMRRPYSSVSKLIGKMVNRRSSLLSSGRNVAEATAGAWLEYRYGWKPLMMDMELIMNSIVGLHQQLKRRVIIRGNARESDDTSEIPFAARASGDLSRMTLSGVVFRTSKLRAHSGVIIDIEPMSTLEMIEKVFGFRCRDLPATLWALTPFSFVADWFLGIENWIQAIIPDPKVLVRGNWVTSVAEIELEYSNGNIVADPIYPNGLSSSHSGTFSTSTVKQVKIVRVTDQSVPITPALTSEVLSLVRQVDAVSLIAGNANNMIGKFRH